MRRTRCARLTVPCSSRGRGDIQVDGLLQAYTATRAFTAAADSIATSRRRGFRSWRAWETPTSSRIPSSAPSSTAHPRRTSAPPRPLPGHLRQPLAQLGRHGAVAGVDLASHHRQGDPPSRTTRCEARERGIDGVVVSNHGGRQVDGAIASLDALPAVVEAAPASWLGPARQRRARRGPT